MLTLAFWRLFTMQKHAFVCVCGIFDQNPTQLLLRSAAPTLQRSQKIGEGIFDFRCYHCWDIPNVNTAQETDTQDSTNNKKKTNNGNTHIEQKDNQEEERNTTTHYERSRGSPNRKRNQHKKETRNKKKEQTQGKEKQCARLYTENPKRKTNQNRANAIRKKETGNENVNKTP